MLGHGRCPNDALDPEHIVHNLRTAPVYDTAAVAAQLERPTSPVPALDNVPGTATHVRAVGVVAGGPRMHC